MYSSDLFLWLITAFANVVIVNTKGDSLQRNKHFFFSILFNLITGLQFVSSYVS